MIGKFLSKTIKFIRSSRKKTLLIGLTILVVLTSISALILYWPKKAEAAWFDDNWAYRKRITVTVTSNSSDISSLETLLTIDTTGITAKLQSACQDLRFTNASGKLLPYYIDSCTNNSATNKVWIQVDLVPKNTTTYIMYMYYGNPGASAASNASLFWRENGLVGYWAANESSWTGDCSTKSVIDSSVKGNNGTACPNGAAANTTTGQYSNAGSFNGTTQYVNIPHSSSLDFGTGPMTYSAWFKTSANTEGFIIDNSNNLANNGVFIDFRGDLAAKDIDARFATSNVTFDQVTSASIAALNDNGWHQAVLLRDGAKVYLYIDGKQISSTTDNARSITNTNSYVIGSSASGGAPHFNGLVDDVRIYNRALSRQEVQDLYQFPGTIATTVTTTSQPTTSFASEEKGIGPVFYSKLDEGTGTTTQDSTKNGSTGTLSGSTTPTWETEDMCVSGKCLFFNGSTGYVDYGRPSALAGLTQISVSFWAKPSTVSVDTGFINNHQSGTDTDGSWEIRVDTSGIITFQLDGVACSSAKIYQNGQLTSSYTQSGNFSTAISTVALTANTWAHIEGTATGCSTLQTPHNLAIGYKELNISGNPSNFYQGFMDDIKIYNYERTAAQVKSDYASRGSVKGVNTANIDNTGTTLSNGLTGYWKFDETSGNAADSSGNGDTLTNNNVATFTQGKFGNSATFVNSSHQYFSIADNATVSTGNIDFTWSGWVYLTTKTNTRTIVNKAANNSLEYAIDYSQPDDRFILLLSSNGVSWDTQVDANNLGSPSINTWYFVTAWYDNTKKTGNIQVNNGTPNSGAAVGDFDGTARLVVGTNGDFGTGLFDMDGQVDDLRFYKRVLSGTERTTLYNWAPGPVGWWKMDEKTGTTTADSSGNGLTGTLTTSPAWTTGKVGAGIDLSPANSYVSVNDNAALDITGDITYEIWAKPKVIDGTTRIVMGKGGSNGSSTTRQYSLRLSSGNQWFAAVYSGSNTYTVIDATTVPSTSRWDHIAIVRDSTAATLKIYTNGVLMKTSTNATGSLNTPANILAIGREGINNQSYFGGYVDDLKIYNYVRTPGQIIQDMNSNGPAERNPIGYWKMDEGYGTTTNDSSVNANPLTLSGSTKPSWTNSGKFGKALSFGGSNAYLAAGSDTLTFKINSTTSLSLSAWINLTDIATQHDIICKYTGTASTSAYCLTVNTSGNLQMLVVNSTGPAIVTTTGTKVLSASTWYHVVGVYSSGNFVSLYVNGVLDTQNTTSIPTQIQNPTTILDIGGENAGSNLMKGTIDEAKIFDYALTLQDIQTDYNQGKTEVLGVLGNNTSYQNQAANQEYCIPGDSTSCAAPIGRWDFEEGSGTTANDTTGNGNTGTWNGTAPYWTRGKIGKAGKLNGTDSYVSTSLQVSPAQYSSITFEAWVYPSSTQNAPGTFQAIIDGDDGGFDRGFGVDKSSGKFEIQVGNTTWEPVSYVANTWQHTVLIYTSSSITFYLNGTSYSYGSAGSFGTSTQGLLIGEDIPCGSCYFTGSVDQVRVFGYSRTVPQIQWDYSRGGPVDWFKFDECQGTVTNDASGNGNNGTITSDRTIGNCSTSSTMWGDGATGKYNYSLGFDGTGDYITTARTVQDDFTLCTWFKTSGVGAGTPHYEVMPLISAETPFAANDFGMGIDSNGKLAFGTGTTDVTIASSDTVNDNSWHLGCATRVKSSGALAVYVDGTIRATGSGQAGNTLSSNSNIKIGSADDGPFNSLSGQVDDVRIYNYVLTQTQIQSLYNQGAAVRFGPVTGTPAP